VKKKGMDHLFVDYITETISIEEAVNSWCSFEHPSTTNNNWIKDM